MTKDLRDKLPQLFTLRDLIALVQDKPDGVLLTNDQAGELYTLLQKQTNPIEAHEAFGGKKCVYHGLHIEVEAECAERIV